jgi:cytochrome c oxidase cbb3-type subunit 3
MTMSVSPNSSSSPAAASAPVERPKTPDAPVLDHEYDGIREYDNPMPGWWVKAFWASFFFAIAYGFHYHLSGQGISVHDAYENEMAVVRAEQARRALAENVTEDGLKKLMLDGKMMADAKAIFAQRCTPCHGEHAQGVIGPNLTDGYWIHGGTLMEIHHTVSEGVSAKGMPAWKMQLSPAQVRELAAFVGTLRNTNVPGKAPEGVLVPPASL